MGGEGGMEREKKRQTDRHQLVALYTCPIQELNSKSFGVWDSAPIS